MNADKTNIMVFPKTKANEICVKLSDTAIKKVQHCRYLGLLIDDTLTWPHHIDTIYSKLLKYMLILVVYISKK